MSRRHHPVWLLALIIASSWASEPMVAVGDSHTVYLADDGTVWCWGDNGQGQLGDGTTSPQLTAKRVTNAEIRDIIAVAAGSFTTFAVRADGTVWSWGRNTLGSAGRNSVVANFLTPGQVLGLPGVRIKAIAAGDRHAMALSDLGRVYVWGADDFGQMGDGGLNNTSFQARDTTLTGIKAVAAGSDHCLVLTSGGKMKAWGKGGDGQIGDGGSVDRILPSTVLMGATEYAMSIACGARHNVAIYSTGISRQWGDNADGQLADGTTTDRSSPNVSSLSYCRSVAAGAKHTLFLRLDSSLVVTGDNSFGQLHLGGTPNYKNLNLGFITDGRLLAAGPMASHTMILRTNGRLAGFGQATSGQLGNGVTGYVFGTDMIAYAAWPVSKVMAAVAGQYHSAGLKSDGTAWGWGNASVGQVGDGVDGYRSAPSLTSSTSFPLLSISSGGDYGDFNVALRADGTVTTWGRNDDRELGNNSVIPYSLVPVAVANTGAGSWTNMCRAVSAGDTHGLAVKQNGDVIGWGSDGNGQLGNGATAGDQTIPTTVSSAILTNVIAVAAGGGASGSGFSLALRADGIVWAWGLGSSGQLGNGAFLSSDIPVSTGLTDVIAIAAGSYHGMALKSDGTVWCWGRNEAGQIGNNTFVSTATPAQVRDGAAVMLNGIRAISGGSYHSLAIGGNGALWTWGSNHVGENGSPTTSPVTHRSTAATIVVAGLPVGIDGGYVNSLFVIADGSVHGFGNNSIGGGGFLPVTVNPTWLPQVSIAITDDSASETGPATGSFQVSRDLVRSQVGSLTVNLSYALGDATYGSAADYITSSPSSITIPPGAASASVTVTPVDDPDHEDLEFETMIPEVSDAPADYQSIPSGGVIKIQDDDVAQVVISPISGNTQETDNNLVAKTFTVHLATRPTDTVTVHFYSSTPAEGQVDPNPTPGNQNVVFFSSITFLASEYGVINAKTIQVFGQQDSIDDGDVPYAVVNYAVGSNDGKYAGNVGDTVAINNLDDDSASIVVGALGGAVTEATGGAQTQTFVIRLGSEPYFPVVFALRSADPSEGNVHPDDSTITLHSGNWYGGVPVRVVGEDDDIDDGNIGFTIDIDVARSDDGAYGGQGPWSVAATCVDDDSRGVTITPSSSRLVSESGVTAIYSVVLTSEPIGGNVTITATADAQGRVGPSAALIGASYALTFTSGNWDQEQFLVVGAVDDATIEVSPHDGDITHGASGADYGGVIINPVDLDITDNDSANFIFAPSSTPASRLITSETGGSVTYVVRPATEIISGTVTLQIWSRDVSEGTLTTPLSLLTASVSGAVIQFPSIDLSAVKAYQPIYFTGGGANSGSIRYVVSVDNTAKTVTVDAALVATVVAETIEVHPLTTLVFDNSNWATGLPVTVIGRGDADSVATDYLVGGRLDASSALRYTAYDTATLADVFLTNLDASGGGVVVTQVGATVVDEATPGSPDTFFVSLSTAPSFPVTISIASGSQVSVSNTQMFFTPTNYATLQSVTVTVVDDAIDEASPHTGTITFSSASTDLNYNNLVIPPVAVSVSDNDTAGITVIPTSGLVTNESLTSASFIVVLASQPIAPVVLGVATNLASEGTASPATLTFTNANWYLPRTVTITGVNDDYDDGDVGYRIVLTGDGSTADANYLNRDPLDVDVSNQDNDSAGVTLGAISNAIDEDAVPAPNATYTLRLNSRPTTTMTINVNAGSQLRVGGLASQVLTFDPALTSAPNGWNVVRTLTVTAFPDFVAEGAHTGTITHTASGGGYGGVAIADTVVSIIEDGDTASLAISSAAVVIAEPATGGSFTVALTSRPLANVTLLVSSGATDQGTVSPSTLTFTPAGYATAQTVTVTPVDDDRVEASVTWSVGMSAFSGDPGYHGLSGSKSITSNDTDIAGILATAVSGATTEAGGSRVFSVRLRSQPSAVVSLGITSDDTTEGTVLPASLGFAAANWNVPQLVLVTGVDDFVDDGLIQYHVGARTAPAITSSDTGYHNLFPFSLDVDNLDDDTAGIRVTPVSGLTTSEAGGVTTFTVVLDSEPRFDVTIATIVSDDGGEGVATPSTLTFTSSNWNTPQTITVTGQPDAIDDADQIYHIVTSDATSADANYNALVVADVTVTNTDDDIPGVTITESGGTAVHEHLMPLAFDLVASNSDSYAVHLDTQPGIGITVTVTASVPVSGTPAISQVLLDGGTSRTLNFDSTNWNIDQFIAVTGVSDAQSEGEPHSTVISHVVGSYTGVTTAASITVSIDDDDAPTMLANAGLAVLRGQIGQVITTGMLRATDEENPAPGSLTYVLQLAPGQGTLRRAGTALTAGMTFTQAQIGTSALTYDHGGSISVSDGFAFRVRDDAGNLGGVELFSFTINVNVPSVALTAGSISFSEDAVTAVFIDTGAAVSDGDSTNFNSGRVLVSLPVGAESEDVLSIAHEGIGPNQIGSIGGVVSYGNLPIGTVVGGNGGADLLINLSTVDATPTSVTALLKRLTYFNSGDNPLTAKTVRIVVTDETTLTSPNADRAIVVSTINDAPVLSSGIIVTPAGVVFTSSVVVSDAEGDDPVLHIFASPGLGGLSGIASTAPPGTVVTTTPTTTGSRTFTYTPTPGRFGPDLFVIEADDGNLLNGTSQLAVNIVITGGSAARPWITSDPPLEIDDDGSLSYTISLSLTDYVTPPTSLTYSLVGDTTGINALFSDGPTTPGPTLVDNNLSTAVTLTIGESTVTTGYIRLGILVTDTVTNTVGYQPLTIHIVPAGGGGG